MPLKTNYRNISWNGLRKYQLIQNQDGTVSFLDVTEYTNVQDAKVLAADLNTNNDLVNRIMAGEFFYTEAESDALLALKQNVLSFDNAPTENSDNPVKSGGIKAALDLINTRINNLKVFAIHVCQSGEYNPDTLVPTVENPDTKTFYLVPSGTGSDLFTEWIYINNRWEIFGSSQIDMSNYVTVTDLQDALDDKQDVLTFDNVPTANSNNPVKSGGVKTALDGKADGDHNHDERYYTESEVNTKLAGKAAADHTHEGVYYTETEVDDLLSEKRDVSDSYSRTEVETLLSAKSDNTHNHDGAYAAKSHTHDDRYYTETEMDAKLAGKAAADHTHEGVYYTETEVDAKLAGKADLNHSHGDIYAAADHNHDSAYAAKSHNHDDRYYTESEMNTKLAGKQDTLTFDTAPTANSTNPVTSGGVKTALDGKAASDHNHDGVYAAADHNHDGAYAAKSHNHDERYYTGTEINTLLAAKQDTLTFDTAPTANSTNPVTSGGVKTALDGKAAASHNHDGVYAAADHNHDGAYAAKSHNHDERYYTETEMNTLLSGKSDTGHTHDESQVEHHTYYVKGTQTAVTGAWTGELPEVDALYNGLTIDYWLPFAGSGNATLNLTLKGGTKTGAKNCYTGGTTRLTTHIGANAIARLVYQTVTINGASYSGWWLVRSQDNNDLAYNIRNGNPAYLANSAVYRYQLLFQVDDNKLTPLNNVNNDLGTSKAMLTGVDFLPFGKIFYYNSTNNVAANANMTTALHYRYNFDLRYSLNCGQTLTANRYVYLKCVRQSSGKFRIAADPCWTQTLPSTNDGYYYIRLGRTYSTYQMYLDEDHPIYYHDGTALRFYTDPAKAVSFAALTGSPTDNSALNTALDGKAASNHNHDGVYAAADHNHDSTYAAKSHNHDDQYYTESETDTKLDAKTNLSQVASEFSASKAYAIDDLVIYQGALYHFKAIHAAGAWNAAHVTACTIAEVMSHFAKFRITGTVSSGNMTLTDARIDSDHWRVPNGGIYFGTPSNVTSGINWSTNITQHTITLSATYSAATSVIVEFEWMQN